MSEPRVFSWDPEEFHLYEVSRRTGEWEATATIARFRGDVAGDLLESSICCLRASGWHWINPDAPLTSPPLRQGDELVGEEMHPNANENDIAGCVECGEPLDQRPSFHCSKCPPPPAIERVSPFPQEPPLGSPEAVEVAAETLRDGCSGFESGCRCQRCAERRRYEMERRRAARDLLAERDALADALEDWLRPWSQVQALQGVGKGSEPYAGWYEKEADDRIPTRVYVNKGEWSKVERSRAALRLCGRLQ